MTVPADVSTCMEQRGETGLFVQLQKPPDEPPEVIHPSCSGTHTPFSRIAITNIKSRGLDCAMTLLALLAADCPLRYRRRLGSGSKASAAAPGRSPPPGFGWLGSGCRLGLGAWAALQDPLPATGRQRHLGPVRAVPWRAHPPTSCLLRPRRML